MYGWIGTILRVNLTSGEITKVPLNQDYIRNYLGQRGLAIKYLSEECAGVDNPLGDKNKLIFMNGPLTGTLGTGTGQCGVATISPINGRITVSRLSGGFGPELKYAGYDGIILEGMANLPVYLKIENEKVELIEAYEIVGKGTSETEKYLLSRISAKARACCIGPVSERMSKYGCIVSDGFYTCYGTGTIMGSKKLKGIVVRGTGSVKVASPEGYTQQVLIDRKEMLADSDIFTQGIATLTLAKDPFYSETSATLKILKQKACFSCPLGCRYVTEITNGPYSGKGECVTLQVSENLGKRCGIKKYDVLTYANWFCVENGLDPAFCGNAISWAIKNKINNCRAENMIPKYGDSDSILEAVRQLCNGNGISELLEMGFSEWEATKKHCTDFETVLLESAGICANLKSAISPANVALQLSLATGVNYTEDECQAVGARIEELEQQFTQLII